MKKNTKTEIGKVATKKHSTLGQEKKAFLNMTKEIHNIVKVFIGLHIDASFAESMRAIQDHFGCYRGNSPSHRRMRDLVTFFTGFLFGLKRAGFDDEGIKAALTEWAEKYDKPKAA